MIDIYRSRRTNYRRCLYWLPSNKIGNKLEHTDTPDGVFYAREENAITDNVNQTAGVFMYDKSELTLYTTDKAEDLVVNSIVNYRGADWIVSNIQLVMHRKETEFNTDMCAARYISIRR